MNREKAFEEALRKIASFNERREDYYGGVSINYAEMCNDMIKIAQDVIMANLQKRTPCEVRTGCCETHPETAYNLHLNELKKVIPEA